AKRIRSDDSITVEPVIDRDTAGVPGSPNIAQTILTKIDQSQIIVCDVSIINSTGKSRPTPNPNVLIELGYALKALGPDRVLMVMNTEFGEPESLPFDLKMNRVVTYKVAKGAADKSVERKTLEAKLEMGIRSIMEFLEKREATSPTVASVSELARSAIEHALPNRKLIARKYKQWLFDALDEAAPPFPDYPSEIEPDEVMVKALETTLPIISDFAQLMHLIASMNDADLVAEVYQWFGELLNRYTKPRGFSGTYRQTRLDFYKFIGHEMFVIVVAMLMDSREWDLIGTLLDNKVLVENFEGGRPEIVDFTYISHHIELLRYRNSRLQSRRLSLHADLLNERHTNGELGESIPSGQFMNADFFLYLRNQNNAVFEHWRPWSCLYLNEPPKFLMEAKIKANAEQLLRPLNVADVEILRGRIAQAIEGLSHFFQHSRFMALQYSFDVNDIGKL
ncbi:MAG: hypothetical protein ACT4QE_03260, partial [Anaerolineales bacterium]